VSFTWPLATISGFAPKLASNWSAVATHWESASTGDIRSALVWLILPAARAVISADALAPPQSTYLRKRVSHVRRHVVTFLGGEPSVFFVDVAFKLVQSQSNARRLLLQALPE